MVERYRTVAEIEAEAMSRLTRAARSYYTSGANNMVTLRETSEAYDEIKLKPAAEVDEEAFEGTKTTFLGQEINSPIGIASTAFHRMAHPDGEQATARAAQAVNETPILLSSWATGSIEEVAENAPGCLKMFQIYMSKKETVNADLWRRCRENGYKAMCLTSDT